MGSLAAGAGLGVLSGALANQKEGGQDAGNLYSFKDQGMDNRFTQGVQQSIADHTFGAPSSQTAENAVQQSGIFGQLYGNNGLLNNTVNNVNDLQNKGFSLTPEDHEAYGQASGDITRMFGQNDQSLSQALSDRGLSNSGVAGQAFSGSLGNKNEQLAGIQMQIANQRMQMNQQRLNSARQFASQLGGQAQQAVQGEFGRRMGENQTQLGNAYQYLGAKQGQSNNNLQQRLDSEHSSTLSNALNGGIGGAMAGAKMGMSGNKTGGMS